MLAGNSPRALTCGECEFSDTLDDSHDCSLLSEDIFIQVSDIHTDRGRERERDCK